MDGLCTWFRSCCTTAAHLSGGVGSTAGSLVPDEVSWRYKCRPSLERVLIISSDASCPIWLYLQSKITQIQTVQNMKLMGTLGRVWVDFVCDCLLKIYHLKCCHCCQSLSQSKSPSIFHRISTARKQSKHQRRSGMNRIQTDQVWHTGQVTYVLPFVRDSVSKNKLLK